MYSLNVSVTDQGGSVKGQFMGFEFSWTLTGEQIQKAVSDLLPQILQALNK